MTTPTNTKSDLSPSSSQTFLGKDELWQTMSDNMQKEISGISQNQFESLLPKGTLISLNNLSATVVELKQDLGESVHAKKINATLDIMQDLISFCKKSVEESKIPQKEFTNYMANIRVNFNKVINFIQSFETLSSSILENLSEIKKFTLYNAAQEDLEKLDKYEQLNNDYRELRSQLAHLVGPVNEKVKKLENKVQKDLENSIPLPTTQETITFHFERFLPPEKVRELFLKSNSNQTRHKERLKNLLADWNPLLRHFQILECYYERLLNVPQLMIQLNQFGATIYNSNKLINELKSKEIHFNKKIDTAATGHSIAKANFTIIKQWFVAKLSTDLKTIADFQPNESALQFNSSLITNEESDIKCKLTSVIDTLQNQLDFTKNPPTIKILDDNSENQKNVSKLIEKTFDEEEMLKQDKVLLSSLIDTWNTLNLQHQINNFQVEFLSYERKVTLALEFIKTSLKNLVDNLSSVRKGNTDESAHRSLYKESNLQISEIRSLVLDESNEISSDIINVKNMYNQLMGYLEGQITITSCNEVLIKDLNKMDFKWYESTDVAEGIVLEFRKKVMGHCTSAQVRLKKTWAELDDLYNKIISEFTLVDVALAHPDKSIPIVKRYPTKTIHNFTTALSTTYASLTGTTQMTESKPYKPSPFTPV